MRTFTLLLMPLVAGIALTYSTAAASGDRRDPGALQEDWSQQPPVAPTVTTPIHEISAPEPNASTGPSAPPEAFEDPPASGETDEERATRVKEKFRQRPGFQEDPPDPQASGKGLLLGGIAE